MPDYCVDCGEQTPETMAGEYIEMESTRNDIDSIYAEMWLCDACLDSRK